MQVQRGIRFRILAVSLTAIVVSTTLISAASLRISSNVLREKMAASASQVLSLAARDIESLLENIVRFTDYIALVDEVQAVVTRTSTSLWEDFSLRKQVDNALERFSVSALQPFVRSLKVFGTNDETISFGSDVFFLEEQRVRDLVRAYSETDDLVHGIWIGVHDQYDTLGRHNDYVISYIRELATPETGEYLGISYLSFDAAIVSSMLPEGDATPGSVVVVDQDNRIIAATSDAGVTSTFDDPSSSRTLRRLPSLMMSREIDLSGWTVHYLIGEDAWIEQRRGIILVTLLVFTVTIVGTVAVELVLVRTLTEPMEDLSRTMMRVRDGDLTARYDYHRNDEIGSMVQTFNYMVGRITTLLETEVESERQKRDAEFQALQAKMNPHFIYNTLTTVRWMALMHDAKPVANAIEILGRLLARTAYARGEVTTVKDELASLDDYVAIQKLRYKGKFDMAVHADPDLLACECPRFTLQPIVENAIFHGIHPKRGTGTVVVSVEGDASTVRISVHDDGVGFPEQPTDDAANHLGLANLDERIRLHYGVEYGLSVESDHESYTTVWITLPRQTGGDHE